MKNLLLLVLIGTAMFCSLYAAAQPKRCNTYESIQHFKSKHPGAETDAQFESWMSKRIAERKLSNSRVLSSYTIPVIFHIVHNGEAVGSGTNLSAARIQQQLNQLNKDFANLSGSKYAGIAAGTGIQFCLAVIDTNGKKLAEPGIQRINRNDKGWAAPPYDGSLSDSYVDATIMPGTIWNPYKYFNVWVLNLGSTLLGKATYPTSSSLAGLGAGENNTHAGVMLHYASVGSVASPGLYGTSYGLGRTLTHEMGHAFGLRHIWGDGNCTATDYCNDTPPQDGHTTGCPAEGTLNGCTEPQPKMFENYMDYTSDYCVNTFTADQVARIQTVMLNSPRRRELATSAACVAPAANSIRWNTRTQTITETAANATVCPGYRDVVFSLNIYDAATAAATVTITKGGTAKEGEDYEILTPTLRYTQNDNGDKPVVIRIWDDGVIESTPETIILQFTIAGEGVTAAPENTAAEIVITDNDMVPVINAAGVVNLLKENFGTNGGQLPTGWVAGSFINPAGANRWTVSSNGGVGFTGQSAHITNNSTTKPNTYSLGSTSNVYLITKQINAKGYNHLTLSFTYKCNGEIWEGTIYDYGALMYSIDGSNFSFLTNAADGQPYIFQGIDTATSISVPLMKELNDTSFYLGFYWYNDVSDGTGVGFTVDDVAVTADALQVGASTTQAGSQVVFAGQEVFITNTDKTEILAKIKNPSSNLGCVNAAIVQGGTGTESITTRAGSFIRTQKVLQLSPAAASNSITYEATLYFTAEELAVWGANKGNLKILKVKDGVSLKGILTSADAEVITPTAVQENTTAGYIAYTGNFKGFSQFMLVSPTFVLPVQLVTFEAQAAGKEVLLSWKTAGEVSNKGFEIERSLNGTQFTKVGWVAGRGNADVEADYKFTDAAVQQNTAYYYRLKQTDNNGSYQYSAIRQVKLAGTGISLRALPNPATDKLEVFISGSGAPATLQLIDAKGGVVGRWQLVNASTAPFAISLSGLPKGIYTLVAILPDEWLAQKVVKQ